MEFGLKDSYKAARKKATKAIPEYNDTIDAFIAGLPKENGLTFFTDL